MIKATLYSDAACPWAYSESPAVRVIEWRYGSQLDWQLVMVGLSEDTSRYERMGYTPARAAAGQVRFRERYGMPFSGTPKARAAYSSRACRAVIAARLTDPGSEWRVFRALQLANFNTPLLLDDDAMLIDVLKLVPGIDAEEIVGAIEAQEVVETYARDRDKTRKAAGSAAELQGKTSTSDGPVRFTAPSVVFESDGTTLVAGGFQPVEAYDILVTNLDPTLRRAEPPETPAPLLEHFEFGLTTQEVAALLAGNNESPDRVGAEQALLELLGDGRALRAPLGDDALWLAPGSSYVAALFESETAAPA
jgi:predicted DsbA family dithiol-disulfide isomerase